MDAFTKIAGATQSGLQSELGTVSTLKMADKVSGIGGLEGTRTLMERATGAVLNPFSVAAYKGPTDMRDFTFDFQGDESFKKEIAPARTFGFMEEVAQLTKMGYASGGKLDNFILLGDKKVLNTKLRFEDEFARHKILDILGDFYLLGKPIRGKIIASKSGHTQNVGLLKIIRDSLAEKN